MNNQQTQASFAGQSVSDLWSIDYKRILYRAIRYWYLIVLSLLLALSIAFVRNRYATKVYPVYASVLVKEAEDISGSELLYSNALVDYQRNYLNELYVIKSTPLIQRVLEDVNFGVTFYREGNILTSETYGDLPFKAVVLTHTDNSLPSQTFNCISETEFTLEAYQEDEQTRAAKRYRFNDTLEINGSKIMFTLPNPERLAGFINDPLIFTYTPPAELAGAYAGRLNAAWAEEGAGVINLSILGTNPFKERDFLAGFIREYQQFDLDKKNETAAKILEFIDGQLTSIADSLERVESQLERFKGKNVITKMDAEAMRLYEKLEELENQRTQLTLADNYYKYLTDYLNRSDKLDQIILPTSVGITDQLLANLVSKLVDLQLDLKMIGATENPLINDSRRKINEIKKDIIEVVNNLKGTDKIKLNFLNAQIREGEKQLGRLPLAERQLVSIQRNYSLLENLYVYLLQKRSEAAITKASNTSDIEIVNPPVTGAPVAPKPTQNYVIAVFSGIAFPLIIFIILELFNTRIQSREDIEKITTIPFIGGVGHKRTDANLEVLSSPKTPIAESFRALRSNLNYFINKKDNAVILITSSISGEGKTFTSINLASVLALSGKKVLLIGADLRKPKIYIDFNRKNDKGLSTYLSGMATLEEIIQHTDFKGFDLVSGGPVPPNPGELLLAPAMNEFIVKMKQQYDYIVIDTPPVAIVADAFALTQYADHSLFIVRQDYTPKDLLKTTQDFFASGKLKNISIVLNDIYRSGPGYGYGYGHGYGYGYGYGKKKDGDGYYS